MSVEHITSLSKFNRVIRDTPIKLIIIDFHATWCGPCHAIAPLYEKLSKTYSDRARFLKVDVDDAEDIAKQCSVSSMPTFQFYRDGRKVSSFSGADPKRLQSEIEKYAPSSSEVSFIGSGQRLSDSGAGASTDAPVDMITRREEAARAAAVRAEKERTRKEREKKRKEEEDDMEETEKNDPRLKVNQNLLNQLVYEMGFPKVRAEKALIFTQNKNVEDAVDWCFEHADDPDIDEPLQVVTESGEAKKRLTSEEAKKKADELYSKARMRREQEDKKQDVEREKERIRSGKEVHAAKAQYEDDERKRAVEEKKREKREAAAERERVRRMLEADKASRRERFRMPGAPRSEERTVRKEEVVRNVGRAVSGGKIQFRFPDGSRVEGEFEAKQTLGDLIKFLVEMKPELVGKNLKLGLQYPRKTFSLEEYEISLGELNLLPRGALSVTIA